MSAAISSPEPSPDEVTRGIAALERHLAEQAPPAPAATGQDDVAPDGYTERVRDLEHQAAEADRIRDIPTSAVLGRRAALEEELDLASLETQAHIERLRTQGERQRATLAAQADRAAAQRGLDADINVRALTLAKRRQRWTRIAWGVLGASLASTAVNVQKFAANGADWNDPQWWVAWCADPVLSALVIGLLLAKGDLSALGRGLGAIAGRKGEVIVWLVEAALLLAALGMNVAPELTRTHGRWDGLVVLHIVIPLAAVAAAAMLPIIQGYFATAIIDLYADAGADPTVRAYSSPTPPTYRRHATVRGSSEAAATAAQVARAQLLIKSGALPADASASRLREELRCGMDTARKVRDALRGDG